MASTKITYTTATLAEELGAESAKALRIFLRSSASGVTPVGKGSRYSLEFGKADINKLKKAFDGWSSAQAERKAAKLAEASEADAEPTQAPAKPRRSRKAQPVDLAAIVDTELAESGAEEIGELADDEPSADELAELADELDEIELDEL